MLRFTSGTHFITHLLDWVGSIDYQSINQSITGGLASIYLLIIIPLFHELRTRSTNYLFWTIAAAHLAQAVLVTPWFKTPIDG